MMNHCVIFQCMIQLAHQYLHIYIVKTNHWYLYILRNSSSFNIFRKSILKFIRPSANSFFNRHNPKGIKFITRLQLGLSQLCEHKFDHSFQDSLNPFCSCSLDIESTAHYLFHCPMYITERRTLLSTIANVDNNLLDL